MSLRINSNVDAIAAHRHLSATSDAISQSMERLSSGLRINKAADDAAGLGISEKMRSQIRGLAQAQRNIQDGVSMVQTAEGNLDEVHSILQRVRELAVQYRNGSLSAAGKGAIQSEVDQLSQEITRIGNAAVFNGVSLLSGTSSVTFQVGANDNETIAISFSRPPSAAPTRTWRPPAWPPSTTPSTPSPRCARASAPCRTASTTPCPSRASTRRT